MYIDGELRDATFGRRIGYVQQEDIHLPTTTVREALEFSALLRQSNGKTKAEKLSYVDTVLDMLEMEAYADAAVGVPGEGLNVEQRKRLTIAVEMVARPDLLLFLGVSELHISVSDPLTNDYPQTSLLLGSTARQLGLSVRCCASWRIADKPSSVPFISLLPNYSKRSTPYYC